MGIDLATCLEDQLWMVVTDKQVIRKCGVKRICVSLLLIYKKPIMDGVSRQLLWLVLEKKIMSSKYINKDIDTIKDMYDKVVTSVKACDKCFSL